MIISFCCQPVKLITSVVCSRPFHCIGLQAAWNVHRHSCEELSLANIFCRCKWSNLSPSSDAYHLEVFSGLSLIYFHLNYICDIEKNLFEMFKSILQTMCENHTIWQCPCLFCIWIVHYDIWEVGQPGTTTKCSMFIFPKLMAEVVSFCNW